MNPRPPSRFFAASAITILLFAAGSAQANDFVDTRINFTVTDENVLVGPGQTNPSIPGLRIGSPNQFGILFFDNYDTRYTGYENLTHIVLYKKFEKGHFEAEGALAIRLLEFSDVNLSTLDDSSYIRVAWYVDASRRKVDNLALTAFPNSADRMRLGYSYRLSWGGDPIFFKYNPDLPASATPPVNNAPAPGARLQWTSERWTLWAGFKTSVLLNKNPNVDDLQAIYGFLGGASVEAIPNHLRLEVNGGYFERGNNPNFYPATTGPGTTIYPNYPVTTAGASFQISAWSGLPPSLSMDYRLFRNDPNSAFRYMQRPVYQPGFTWLVQSEFTYITTTVQDFENTNSTTRQYAYAGDVNLRAQIGHARLKADISLRSLEFILINQPSLVPYTSLPNMSQVNPDRFVSVGADYNFERIGLTLGPTLGIDFPANITPPTAIPQLCGNTGGSLCTPATIVVRGEGDYSILPVHDAAGNPVSALPVIAGKLQVREDFLEYFAAILDIYYSHDPNQTHLTKASDGTEIRDFNHPETLGFNLTLQARF